MTRNIVKRLTFLRLAMLAALVIIVLAAGSTGHAHAATSCLPGDINQNGTCTGTPPADTTTTPCEKSSFFGLIPWYQYLDLDSTTCDIKHFTLLPGGGKSSDVPLVLLAILNDLLRIVGLAAIGFVIYGAIQYITSQGNPEDTAKARGTIINALVGMAIAMVAVGLVSFIGKSLGG